MARRRAYAGRYRWFLDKVSLGIVTSTGAATGRINAAHTEMVGFCVVYLVLLLDWELPLVFANAPTAYWALDIAKFVIVPGAVIWLMTRRGGAGRLSSLGFGAGQDPRGRAAVFTSIVVCVFLLPLVWLIPKPLPWPYLWPAVHLDFYVGSTISHAGLMYWFGLIYLALAPAVTEEIFFRGVLYLAFSRWTSRSIWYVLTSALLFASIHWEQGSTVTENAFIYGLVAAWILTRVKSLLPLIAGHFVTNLLVFSRLS